MAERKIQKMHKMFGKTDGKQCRDCKHLYGEPGGYRKCLIYGNSRSESTDWNLSYVACGLFNRDDYKGDIPVYKLNVGGKQNNDTQCEGQMSFF